MLLLETEYLELKLEKRFHKPVLLFMNMKFHVGRFQKKIASSDIVGKEARRGARCICNLLLFTICQETENCAILALHRQAKGSCYGCNAGCA